MKIKKFNENVESDRRVNKLSKWSDEFDSFVQLVYDIYDDYDINIKFSTADGSRKSLDIEEYRKASSDEIKDWRINIGDDYSKFITALSNQSSKLFSSISFNVTFDIKKNEFNSFLEVIKFIKSARMSSTDWKLTEFQCNHFENITIQRAHYIVVAYFSFSGEITIGM